MLDWLTGPPELTAHCDTHDFSTALEESERRLLLMRRQERKKRSRRKCDLRWAAVLMSESTNWASRSNSETETSIGKKDKPRKPLFSSSTGAIQAQEQNYNADKNTAIWPPLSLLITSNIPTTGSACNSQTFCIKCQQAEGICMC